MMRREARSKHDLDPFPEEAFVDNGHLRGRQDVRGPPGSERSPRRVGEAFGVGSGVDPTPDDESLVTSELHEFCEET